MKSLFEKNLTEAWETEFPKDYKPPQEILDLVAEEILEDQSWGNDSAPSFKLANAPYVVWVYPEEGGEFPDEPRYTIVKYSENRGYDQDPLFTTDSLEAVIHWIRKVSEMNS